MADDKPKTVMSQDLKLPSGVTVTPDHEVVIPSTTKVRFADRRIDANGVPEEVPGHGEFGSTYADADHRQPVAPVDQSALPRESVQEANAPSEPRRNR
jgi:hypothetical protein